MLSTDPHSQVLNKNSCKFLSSSVHYCLISYRAEVWHYRILPDFFINSNFMMAANGTKVAPRTCWHWSCASTFCKNSWKTPNVEYYTLTKVGSFESPGKAERRCKFQEAGHLLNALVVWQEIKFKGLAKCQIY